MKGEILMGWAKYAEDNFEIYLERIDAVRQQKSEIKEHFSREQNIKNNNFSLKLAEESCFSLH